ncbi:ArgP/LysG family DNA-binding transcriptional regulator [Alteromonas gracilis]
MQTDHLLALEAVVDEGTFDAAARRLGITPSAVSQRIKALETAAGRVLVTRQAPCRATPGGEPALRLARQVGSLLAASRHELGLDDARTTLRVAVNADSLSTWFPRVFAEVAAWGGVDLRITVADQDDTVALLRAGAVSAAVTSAPEAPAGCRVRPLGTLRYVPARSAAAREPIDWTTEPLVRFDPRDRLQQTFLERSAPGARPPVVEIPEAGAYVAAIAAGLGWGLLMDEQMKHPGVRRIGREHLDVGLHWHTWRLADGVRDRLTEAVVTAARETLGPPASPSRV